MNAKPPVLAFSTANPLLLSSPACLRASSAVVRRRPRHRRRALDRCAVHASSHDNDNDNANANGVCSQAPRAASALENVVIIGSGPAGYTAALYAGRANLRPVVLEGVASGVSGGQLMTTHEVENFPGFPAGITGPELMDRMRAQAVRWGARVLSDDAVSVDLDTQPFVVRTSASGPLRTHAVIVATGASARRLHIPGEDALWGRGISACAICDGAAPIFAAAPVAVVGGGDSACEEATYLTKYARHVHLLVRAPKLSASPTLADRALNHPSVSVHFNTVVVSAAARTQHPQRQQPRPSTVHTTLVSSASVVSVNSRSTTSTAPTRTGRVTVDDRRPASASRPPPGANAPANGHDEMNNSSPLRAVRVRDVTTGAERDLDVRGLFYAIGHTPNTAFLRGSSRLRFDDGGYLATVPSENGSLSGAAAAAAAGTGRGVDVEAESSSSSRGYAGTSPYTGQAGVFAAGDVADRQWRQAVTAAGSGCMAALAAERYLAEQGLTIEYHQDEARPPLAQSAREATQSAEEQAAEQRGNDDESNYDADNTWHKGQFALRKLYHESKRPLIVKYISPTCGPCRQLKPMLHAVVRALEDRVHYVEIDISKDADIAEAAGVTGSPTVQIFHEKSLIKEFKGVKMKSEYRRVVESILQQQEREAAQRE